MQTYPFPLPHCTKQRTIKSSRVLETRHVSVSDSKTHRRTALIVIGTGTANASISINQRSRKSHSNSHYYMAIKLMQLILIPLHRRNPVTVVASDSWVIWLHTPHVLLKLCAEHRLGANACAGFTFKLQWFLCKGPKLTPLPGKVNLTALNPFDVFACPIPAVKTQLSRRVILSQKTFKAACDHYFLIRWLHIMGKLLIWTKQWRTLPTVLWEQHCVICCRSWLTDNTLAGYSLCT